MNDLRRTTLVLSMIALAAAGPGCQDTDLSTLSEKAGLEAQKQQDVEAATRAKRAAEMEEDLATRQRFFEAVRGVYEGKVQTEQGEFNIRLTLIPSLPPYRNSRVRTFEEIAADLNGLHFTAQVVQWNPKNKLSAVGCRVEDVHPDLARGEIHIASEQCANVYLLRLAERVAVESDAGAASRLATSIIEGKQEGVPGIVGEILPTTNASVYGFAAAKVVR